MKKINVILLSVLLFGCSNTNNSTISTSNHTNNNSSNISSNSSSASSISSISNNNESNLDKDDYGNVYGDVAQVLYTYNGISKNNIKRQMDEVNGNGDLFSIAVMFKMFSEIYLSEKFSATPLDVVTVKGVYEDAEMIFDLNSSFEDGYILGAIRSFSEVFAPEESFNYIKVNYDFSSNNIISFDLYADYIEDGIEYAHYDGRVITRLNQDVKDEEFNTVESFVLSKTATFREQIKDSVVLKDDFSLEIATVVEYSPY